ncbi:protein of unknown function [Amycolatopsis arida]|uniref:DUF1707 domain-containing protein n=1 Tax=Amycolatopsis arida TaxID=587909 RepID=A0A1I6ALU6_9PSEU|nr:DUF1707 domain-containing protein [Amycolatopsis arida]TDX87388.1 uncharacterized protein DUF1707 [Amycolatopsis arida]SFQ69656.1 protein of unknown function [Amycolatopsis arida]
MADPGIRASDAERERTVAVLRREVGTGRLSLDEFADRAGLAYGARTVAELDALTADLPGPASPWLRHARLLSPPMLAGVVLLLGLALFALGAPVAMGATLCH